MRYGTTNSSKGDFDCRAAWCIGECIKIRLSYEAIGFSDPSSLQALWVGRVGLDGSLTTESVSRVGISVAIGTTLYLTKGYSWDPWQKISWHERLKTEVETYAKAVAAVATR